MGQTLSILGGDQNTIGGMNAGERNVISGNGGDGVEISGGANQNTVIGNYIGTDKNGTEKLENTGYGVRIEDSATNTIGGNAPTDANGVITTPANVISGNTAGGVLLFNNAAQNTLQGNFIGTKVNGTQALGNERHGVEISLSSGNVIGGLQAGTRNVISSNGKNNTGDGVRITGATSDNNMILGNNIGTNKERSKTAGLGNVGDGVFIADGAHDNRVKESQIAFNGRAGFKRAANAGTSNKSTDPNSIVSNGALGIDVDADGVTLTNVPTFTSAVVSSGVLTVQGYINGTPNTTFTFEFFGNTTCDPSGYGEGEDYIATTIEMTDGNGYVAFQYNFTSWTGSSVTVAASDESDNTWEFSNCGLIAQDPGPGPGSPHKGRAKAASLTSPRTDRRTSLAGDSSVLAAPFHPGNDVTLDLLLTASLVGALQSNSGLQAARPGRPSVSSPEGVQSGHGELTDLSFRREDSPEGVSLVEAAQLLFSSPDTNLEAVDALFAALPQSLSDAAELPV
jgi:hypothetical protein